MTAALKFSDATAPLGLAAPLRPASSDSRAVASSLSGESFASSRAAEMVAHVTESLAKVLPRDVAEERARNVVSGMLLYLWDAFDAGHAQGVRDAASELPAAFEIGGES